MILLSVTNIIIKILAYVLFTIIASTAFVIIVNKASKGRIFHTLIKKVNLFLLLDDGDNTMLSLEEEIAKSNQQIQDVIFDIAKQRDEIFHEYEVLLAKEKEREKGYIILDLPNDLRSMFTDLLKGFEEFALLKGYNIAFSVDNSVKGKMAFKFTLQEGSEEVSDTEVRKDIQEYIDKVKKGDDFDYLPNMMMPQEHSLVLTTLKNRISTLQHNYNLEKNSREHYENMFKQFADGRGISSQPSVFVQTGGSYIPYNMTANNSHGLALGQNVSVDDSSDNSNHNQITISNSFNTRKEQVGKIDEIIELLRQNNEIAIDTKQSLITNFDKIKEEIADEEKPDKRKIFKWLTNIDKTMDTTIKVHKMAGAVQWLYDSLNFISGVI